MKKSCPSAGWGYVYIFMRLQLINYFFFYLVLPRSQFPTIGNLTSNMTTCGKQCIFFDINQNNATNKGKQLKGFL